MSQANAAPVGTRAVARFGLNNTNIFADYKGLIDTTFYNPSHRANHSFQFNHDAAGTWNFWKYVKNKTGFEAAY